MPVSFIASVVIVSVLARALGALSGFFGGIIGNQGGLRAAALSRFDLRPTTFVATSTMIGVMIDLVRSPVYVYRAGHRSATSSSRYP
ncbi:MAG TPA: hypothetical protein VM099_16415 [Gemmatimonadaceae bacterium]|nr:hypothetical protein [Gemmatimonadaceae bacterium]